MHPFAEATLASRSEALANPCPIPSVPGIYGWFFRNVPARIPVDGCLKRDGLTLLYLGIAPDRHGKPNSKQTLRSRICYHFRGNAEGSTLRRTLGVLLEEVSGYPLRRVGSGKRRTLTHLGEQWLDDWLDRNAFVAWKEHPQPWIIERKLLLELCCPLNLSGNQHHVFAPTLKGLRKEAVERANAAEIANEHNQVRSRDADA